MSNELKKIERDQARKQVAKQFGRLWGFLAGLVLSAIVSGVFMGTFNGFSSSNEITCNMDTARTQIVKGISFFLWLGCAFICSRIGEKLSLAESNQNQLTCKE